MAIKIDGINVHVDKRSEYVKPLSCEWVRIDVNWWVVEKTKNKYNWTDIDKLVAHYNSAGIKIYATIGYTPKYISDSQLDMPPIDRWIAFVDNFSKRFKDSIDVVSIWNEPNLNGFFNGTMHDYFHGLLITASPLIRENAPNMKIAAPEISTLNSSNWWHWLREARHHSKYFDIVSIHSYADNVIRCFRYGKVPILGWIIPKWGSYNKYLKKIGKPVFLTECGYEAHEDDYKEQKKQKEYLEYVQKNKRKAKIDVIMFYTLRDAIDFNAEGPFGLYTRDWHAKKASAINDK